MMYLAFNFGLIPKLSLGELDKVISCLKTAESHAMGGNCKESSKGLLQEAQEIANFPWVIATALREATDTNALQHENCSSQNDISAILGGLSLSEKALDLIILGLEDRIKKISDEQEVIDEGYIEWSNRHIQLSNNTVIEFRKGLKMPGRTKKKKGLKIRRSTKKKSSIS